MEYEEEEEEAEEEEEDGCAVGKVVAWWGNGGVCSEDERVGLGKVLEIYSEFETVWKDMGMVVCIPLEYVSLLLRLGVCDLEDRGMRVVEEGVFFAGIGFPGYGPNTISDAEWGAEDEDDAE